MSKEFRYIVHYNIAGTNFAISIGEFMPPDDDRYRLWVGGSGLNIRGNTLEECKIKAVKFIRKFLQLKEKELEDKLAKIQEPLMACDSINPIDWIDYYREEDSDD